MSPTRQTLRLSFVAAAVAAGLIGAAAQTPALVATGTKPRISAAQAAELFRSVDTILRFDSKDTGLAIHREVKRKLLTREEVVAFLKQKMDEDKDTARIERSAIVLEKFGLLPPHFALRPFLLKLLGEQVAGFYDSKTKTVNLLDWVDADTQKPVMAHELTHALQDQYQSGRGVNLDDWENAGPEGTATNVAEDREHIRYDETDTAREAVLEGQAMVAYYDWYLSDKGRSLRTLPDLSLGAANDTNSPDDDSPILDSAPLVLRESLLFPYQEGLVFEQHLLRDRGTQAAFADALNRPPDTSLEIMHPEVYEHGEHPPLLAVADLHPLLDRDWAPYDVGVMGALDVRILGEALADKGAGADAALAWDGGIYYAAQTRSAQTEAAKDSTASIALIYLSRWKNPVAAAAFAKLYLASLPKRYPDSQLQEPAVNRTITSTNEGPVIVAQQDRYVFVSHSLSVPLAETVMHTMIDAQSSRSPAAHAASRGASQLAAMPGLGAPLRAFLARQGTMRAALPRVY